MSKANRRLKQISDTIQKTLANVFCRSPREPWFTQVTIIAVEVSADLKIAKVFFTVIDPAFKDEISLYLKNNVGFFRSEVATGSILRYTPQLKFIYDTSIEHGDRIVRLINSLPDKS